MSNNIVFTHFTVIHGCTRKLCTRQLDTVLLIFPSDDIRLGVDALSFQLSLKVGVADPEALLMAVAHGDVETVDSALKSHPEMVKNSRAK